MTKISRSHPTDGRSEGPRSSTLTAPDGAIDLLVAQDGSSVYSALRRHASQIDIDGMVVRVASIDWPQ